MEAIAREADSMYEVIRELVINRPFWGPDRLQKLIRKAEEIYERVEDDV